MIQNKLAMYFAEGTQFQVLRVTPQQPYYNIIKFLSYLCTYKTIYISRQTIMFVIIILQYFILVIFLYKGLLQFLDIN